MNRLRTTAILAVLAAAAAGAATAQNAAPANPAPTGPQAVAPEPVHDFGTITAGAKVEHEFLIRNDGNAPLLLREVRSDCACAATSYDETITPGTGGVVGVVLDSTDMTGPMARTITVLTNDPKTPSIALTVKATVAPVLLMRPGYARYIYVQKETPGLVGQTLYAVDGGDFKVLSVKSPYPFLAVSFREATAEERRPEGKGRQWRVETVLAPDSPVGSLAEWVEIVTDHPRQKVVRLPISGFVRPVLTVTPPAGELGPRNLANPKLGSLTVQVFSTEAIPVTRVDTDIEGLLVELRPTEAGRSYKIDLALSPRMAKGDFRGVVRIYTDSPKAPLTEVPIKGRLE